MADAATISGFPFCQGFGGEAGAACGLVRSAAKLAAAFFQSQERGKAAFGADRMLREICRLIPPHRGAGIAQPRNMLSLFEREGTLKRRHQTVIEEAPVATLKTQRDAVCAAGARRPARCELVAPDPSNSSPTEVCVLHRDDKHTASGRASVGPSDHRQRSGANGNWGGFRRKSCREQDGYG